MKTDTPIIRIGSRVRLIEEVDMGYCVYSKGHEFKVTETGIRGCDLEDDDGNKIRETGMIHYKFELI
jgi:hypothetical protein